MRKDKKNLGIEELEKRAAPLAVPGYTESPDPSDPTGGGGGAGDQQVASDQPGNSDGHRDKLWKKS